MDNDNTMTDLWALVNLQGGVRIPVNFRWVQYFTPAASNGTQLYFVSGDHLTISNDVASIFSLIGNATDDITTLVGQLGQARAA